MKKLLLSLALLGPVAAVSQTPDTATVRGVVVDAADAVVPGVSIHASNTLTGLDRATISGPDGTFALAGLPVEGDYKLVAVKQGFAAAERDHIALAGGTTAAVHLQLSVAHGKEAITVQGAIGDLRIDQPQLGTRLDSAQIAETPLQNRRITYLPLLNAANRPAINQGDIFMDQDLFTTNGAGRRQTWFEVDGSTGNDSWGRQTIFTNVPLAAVQEMTVLTNSFSSEYGISTGSVVNIVTRAGSSNYHGEFAGLWRPNAPEARLSGFLPSTASSGNDLSNDRLVQESFTASGPFLIAPRTEFFLAAEHSDERKASPVISPLAPGNYIGVYHDWLGFLRLDHQLSDANNLFLRANVDAYYDTNPNGIVGGNNLPTVARVFHRRTWSAELGDTAVLSPRLLNNARLQFQLASPITQFDPVVDSTQYVVPIAGLATFTSGTSQSALLMNRQYQINDTLTETLSHQQINIGGGFIVAHNGGNSKEFGGPNYLGTFTYATCTGPGGPATSAEIEAYCEGPAYLNNIQNVTQYSQSFGDTSYTVTDVLSSLFVQDDISVNHSLTLNAGLRYERQSFTDATMSFGPRAGFVYNVAGMGRMVVRGGFGLYYSQVVDNSQANYTLSGPTGVFTFTATPGQAGFPSATADAPLSSVPQGSAMPIRSLYLRPGRSAYYDQFFPTSTLVGYPDKLLNPYSEQYTLGVEQQLAPEWILSLDYIGTHQLRNVRPLDVDAPAPFIRTAQGQTRSAQSANCMRPYWIAWYAEHGTSCGSSSAGAPPYSVIQSDVNDGYLHYNALDVNLRHAFRHGFEMLASYTWSHTLDNVDPDIPNQNPNDANFTGRQEYGNAIYDQRHRFVLSGLYAGPFQIHFGGVMTLASGLPYNLTTGTNNSGDTGATADRPVIGGVVAGRNTGRGTPLYEISPFLSRDFSVLNERAKVQLRVEAFNVLNHANFVGFNGTYGNGASAPATLGTPLAGVTAQLPPRSLQFSGKVSF